MWYLGCVMPSHIYTCYSLQCLLSPSLTNHTNTWGRQLSYHCSLPERMCSMGFFRFLWKVGLCFRVLGRKQDVWFRPRHPRPGRGRASIHQNWLQSPGETIEFDVQFIFFIFVCLEHWSFNDRIPSHGVTRLPLLKPRHSQAGRGGGQGGGDFQLLVPQLLSAALWHWHSWCEEQVHVFHL